MERELDLLAEDDEKDPSRFRACFRKLTRKAVKEETGVRKRNQAKVGTFDEQTRVQRRRQLKRKKREVEIERKRKAQEDREKDEKKYLEELKKRRE